MGQLGPLVRDEVEPVVLVDQLGHELDLALDYALDLGAVALRLRGEFAWFRPGDIFARPGAEGGASDQVGAWLHGEVAW